MKDEEKKKLRVSPPTFMNETEVAIFTGLSPRTVRTYTNKRVLPVARVGRRKVYRSESVIKAIKELER